MRIYEIVSNQNITNEQILTEIDWKKLRNALIGGAMSLAVLGAPGKAIAQSLDTNKITPDQAIELIQKKLASGEIKQHQIADVMSGRKAEIDRLNQLVKPGQIKPTKLKADPDDFYTGGGDVDRYLLDNLPFPVNKIGMITKGNAAGLLLPNPQHPLHKHFSQTTDQWSKFLEPGDSTAPQKAYMKWRMSTDDAVVKNVKQDEPNKSADVKKDEPKKTEPTVKQDYSADLSIKGVKFGMTVDEVRDLIRSGAIGGNLVQNIFFNDISKKLDVNFKSLLGVSDSMGDMDATLEFDEDGRLVLISFYLKTEVMVELVNAMSDKFGSPNRLQDVQWQNKAGATFPNKKFNWDNVKGAKIVGAFRGNNRDYGFMAITSIKVAQKAMDIGQAKKTKDQADF
jgi:hypothetical protein